MSPGTPKFKSKEFKDADAAVKAVFDAHSLGVVLIDALERRAAEQIVGRSATGGVKGRLTSVSKADLVGQITQWFFTSPEVAYQVMKEMDRACQKERHIVASIPEEQAPDRVGSYRALALRRERAKFVWALSRDDRESVRKLANRVINEFFAAAADLETARQIVEGEAPAEAVQELELAKRLRAQADQLGEATARLSDLESKLGQHESERAMLLVQMGSKERILKQQAERREELEGQLDELKRRLQEIEDKEREAERARIREQEARQVAEDLAQKVRRLEKLAGAAETLSEVQAQLEQERRRIEQLERQHATEVAAYQRERAELDKERGRLRADLDATREELRRARKRIEALERGELERESDGGEARTVVLCDQANLAAVAHQVFRRKVNFAQLLETLRSGRRITRAIAFVVDNGGTNFDGFCDTLRRSGWDLRIKRPKRFSDGRSKADWDMGIAMEAIDLREKAEALILVSGDGDFAPLVRRLQRSGQRVEVAAFPEGLANELMNVADGVLRLDERALE